MANNSYMLDRIAKHGWNLNRCFTVNGVEMKRCPGCMCVLVHSEFATHARKCRKNPMGLPTLCRLCERQKERRRRRCATPEQRRKRRDQQNKSRRNSATYAASNRLRKHERRKRERAGDRKAVLEYMAAVLSRSVVTCHWCGCDCTGRVEFDHVMPMCRGGDHLPENIVPSCKQCNLSKGTKTPEEWNGGRRRG